MPGYHAGYMRQLESALEIAGADRAPGGVNGAGVNLANWDGVVFQALLGTFTGAGVFDLRVVESENANFSGAVNVANAAIVQQTNADPNVVVSIDVFRPTNLYLRVVATVTTNNVAFGVISHKYRAQGRTPVTLPNGAQYVSVRAN